MKKRITSKGFTLVELLVTSLISVIVMTGIVMIVTENARLSASFQKRTDAYNKLNLASRMIEMKIKEGAVVKMVNRNQLHIYDFNNNFTVGFFFNTNNELRYCSEDGSDLASVSPLLAHCKFTGSKFTAKSSGRQDYAFFDLKMDVYDENNKLKFEAAKVSFNSKCRSSLANQRMNLTF